MRAIDHFELRTPSPQQPLDAAAAPHPAAGASSLHGPAASSSLAVGAMQRPAMPAAAVPMDLTAEDDDETPGASRGAGGVIAIDSSPEVHPDECAIVGAKTTHTPSAQLKRRRSALQDMTNRTRTPLTHAAFNHNHSTAVPWRPIGCRTASLPYVPPPTSKRRKLLDHTIVVVEDEEAKDENGHRRSHTDNHQQHPRRRKLPASISPAKHSPAKKGPTPPRKQSAQPGKRASREAKPVIPEENESYFTADQTPLPPPRATFSHQPVCNPKPSGSLSALLAGGADLSSAVEQLHQAAIAASPPPDSLPPLESATGEIYHPPANLFVAAAKTSPYVPSAAAAAASTTAPKASPSASNLLPTSSPTASAKPQSSPSITPYVSTERNREVRQNYAGVACKQCERFYELVGKGKDTEDGRSCEHVASRHRYEFPIALTPESYWDVSSPKQTATYVSPSRQSPSPQAPLPAAAAAAASAPHAVVPSTPASSHSAPVPSSASSSVIILSGSSSAPPSGSGSSNAVPAAAPVKEAAPRVLPKASLARALASTFQSPSFAAAATSTMETPEAGKQSSSASSALEHIAAPAGAAPAESAPIAAWRPTIRAPPSPSIALAHAAAISSPPPAASAAAVIHHSEAPPPPAEYLPTSQELELEAELHGHGDSQVEAAQRGAPLDEMEQQTTEEPAPTTTAIAHYEPSSEEASLAF